jgi:hypothetical protein
LFFVTFVILLALFGGHVVQNAMNMTYLCLFVLKANVKQILLKKDTLCPS